MTTSSYKTGTPQGYFTPAPHSGFALLDGLASVKQIVDSSEDVKNSYSYEAFGQPTVGQSDVANPYLFVGGYGVQWESPPSLYFMQARYYSPGVGRFISEDPYGGSPQDPLSLHRYFYCANGPVTGIDPSGQYASPLLPVLIGVGVVVGVAVAWYYLHIPVTALLPEPVGLLADIASVEAGRTGITLAVWRLSIVFEKMSADCGSWTRDDCLLCGRWNYYRWLLQGRPADYTPENQCLDRCIGLGVDGWGRDLCRPDTWR